MTPRRRLVVGYVLTGIAVALALAALAVDRIARDDGTDRTARADGVVVAVERDDWRSWCRVVEFTVDGERREVRDDVCTDDGTNVGDAVTVRYDPRDPRDAAVEDWWARWGAVTTLAVLAATTGGVGVLTIALVRRGGGEDDVPR
ncbi:DUF3592 domain-containing protein [Jiangella asiatica]|uniref:DUF3592 domain-containing protein n=1 Tax=Jiangella asiatica TaxID=2530372 RepID=UPI0013A5D5B1|nr:DUF3592 domain-containing protein [Jiangella asiatica]